MRERPAPRKTTLHERLETCLVAYKATGSHEICLPVVDDTKVTSEDQQCADYGVSSQ